MKWLTAFCLVFWLSGLAYAENDGNNPYEPPHGTPTLLTLRDFEHEYDLAMEKGSIWLGNARFALWKMQQLVLGYGNGAMAGLLLTHAYSQPQNLPHIGAAAVISSGLTLAVQMILERDSALESRAEQESLLSEERYEHLRPFVDTSKPMPCRSTVAQLANPFRRSRVKSRLGPITLGFGAAVVFDHWLHQNKSALSRLNSFFPKK